MKQPTAMRKFKSSRGQCSSEGRGGATVPIKCCREIFFSDIFSFTTHCFSFIHASRDVLAF